MSDTAVLEERMNTHIQDSTSRHKEHENRLLPLERFMEELKIDIKWVQRIGVGILAVVVSPYAVELFKYLIKQS